MNTEIKLKQIVSTIPPALKKVLVDFDIYVVLKNIGIKYSLSDQIIEETGNQIMLVLLGVAHPGDLQTKIEPLLKNKDLAVQILNDINSEVFIPIRRLTEQAELTLGLTSQQQPKFTKEEEEIIQQYNQLPKSVRDTIVDGDLDEKIENIGIENKLTIAQLDTLENIISLILLGFIHEENYEERIKEALGLNQIISKKITTDIELQILKNIQGDLNEYLKKIDSLDNKVSIDYKKNISSTFINSRVAFLTHKHGLSLAQGAVLLDNILFVIEGITKASDFELKLKKSISLPVEKMLLLIEDINTTIFSIIRLEMQQVSEKKELPIEKKITDVDIDLDDNDELTQAVTVQNIELPAPEVVTPPAPEKIVPVVPNIIEKKMAESFSIPKIESDHSIPAIKKEPSSGIDPYREQIQ